MLIQIVKPPQFEPFQPYLAGPYLKSLLGQLGIIATLCDANIDFYDWLLSQASGARIESRLVRHNSSYLRRHAPDAVRTLLRPPVSMYEYRWAINVADEYLRAVSPEDVKIGLTYLKVGNRYSSADLRRHIERDDNMFSQYFEHAAEKILGGAHVSMYLLSLVVIDQLAAAVVFAREIKRRRPRARVIIGGPLVSRLHRQLKAVPWLAATFDAIVPGEAHRVLPGVLGLAQGYTGHITPDFSDLDLDRYWSCQRVLPYIIAHGCKWGRCAFCSHHLTYDGYRSSAMREVVADLESLSAKHNAQYISFCDEYLTPDQLVALADGMNERQIDVKWSTFARPEPQFRDRDYVQKLYSAGCRMLMFGLESGSQQMLQAMKKGTKVVNYRPILEACKNAKIAVRCDFMVGFPGETEEDARNTYNFISGNRDVIDTPFSSYSVGVFELRGGTPVLASGDSFRVLTKDPLRGDLDDQYEYESLTGLSAEQRIEWREKLIRLSKHELGMEMIAPQNKTHQLVLKDLYDQGLISLPVLRIAPEDFTTTIVRLARGVECLMNGSVVRLFNRANGGELEVDHHLANVFSMCEKGADVQSMFGSQSLWDSNRFSKLINYLYRNDYIEARKATPGPTVQDYRAGVPMKDSYRLDCAKRIGGQLRI